MAKKFNKYNINSPRNLNINDIRSNLETRSNQKSEWATRCLDMYLEMIEFCYSRGIDKSISTEYLELHHLIPLSFGGYDIESNLILLSVEEHILAHILLYEIYKSTMTFNTVILILYSRVKKNLLEKVTFDKITSLGFISDKEYFIKNCTFSNLNGSFKVINLCTGEIYNSLRDASRKLNVDRDKINRILRDGLGLKFYVSGDENLVDTTKVLDLSHRLHKPVINIQTGKIYHNMKELSKELGITRKTLKFYISKEDTPYEYLNESDGDLDIYLNPNNRPVIADGKLFPSVFMCARHYNRHEGYIKDRCLDLNDKNFNYFYGDIAKELGIDQSIKKRRR